PNRLNIEQGSLLEPLIPAFEALGHAEVRAATMPLKANAVEVIDGRLMGAADPRSEGAAASE
ncbi:MAG TPA: gamma-glutamyltransferase, partial [Novosphingobium sp.]|nr:gamma-glutamyltransferase [Novosphingobium sp.]